MTTLPRDRATRLIVALALAAVIALPRAALADDQFDKMRAKIVAFVGDKMEKLGGSRIIYEVDSSGLRESVVTDLRDDVYKNLHDGHIAFSNLAIRDGGVDVKIADAKGRDQLARKLASAADGLPSHALAVTDGSDGAVRLAPTQSGTPPEGSEVLLGFKDKKPYLVAKESALDGEDISYAAPGLCGRHQGPGRHVPLQRTRHAALRPRHRRERRQALRHRARRQGDLRPRDPRAHHRRLGPALGEFR